MVRARRQWEHLSPSYRRRIERTVGRTAYETGAPLQAARGHVDEVQKAAARKVAKASRSSSAWVPADSTVRSWWRVARSNGVSRSEFNREMRIRGPQWIGNRTAAILKSRKMTDIQEKQQFMIDQYIDFKDFDVDSSWFFYGSL